MAKYYNNYIKAKKTLDKEDSKEREINNNN
jgi:hypothetical protein